MNTTIPLYYRDGRPVPDTRQVRKLDAGKGTAEARGACHRFREEKRRDLASDVEPLY